MAVAPAIEVASRPRRSLVSRLSAGHLVMALAGLLGALLTLAALRSADDTIAVAVARHDLEPGTVVGADSFRLVDVKVGASTAATLLPADRIGAVAGQVLVRPLHEGELVTRSLLQPASSGAAGRSMSFAVSRDRAVGGDLSAGDRIDVVAADDGTARYVLTAAEVLDVDTGGSGPLRGGTDDVTVTVAVDERTAIDLAAALDGGTVTLVRSTGAAVAAASSVPADPEAGRASSGGEREAAR